MKKFLALFAVMAMVLAACGGDDEEATDTTAAPDAPATTAAPDAPATTAD